MNSAANVGKKAVHVKWAGKTIALGTFLIAEADDKCARAKALTRAWRSTMRPKPSRAWVMLELERLNVRVVSARVAQKESSTSDSDNGDDDNPAVPSRFLSNIINNNNSSNNNSNNNNNNNTATTALTITQQPQQQLATTGILSSIDQDLLNLNHHHRNSITTSLLNGADLGQGNDQRNSLASLDSSFFFNHQGSTPDINLNANTTLQGDNTARENISVPIDAHIPPARPYVGGGSAAAYEATREDHYRKIAERKKLLNKDGGESNGGGNNAANNLTEGSLFFDRTAVGGLTNDVESLGALNQIGAGIGVLNQQINMSSSATTLPSNDHGHYEMLKLHHMNLLNEIQETNLMMNLYQQQQLQQQQLQQDQLNNNRFIEPQPSLLSLQLDLLAGASGMCQPSAGLGLDKATGGNLGLDSLMGQHNSLSQIGELVEKDLGMHHIMSSSIENSSGSNNNSMIYRNIDESINNGINSSSSNIAANSSNIPTVCPSNDAFQSVNESNSNGEIERKDSDEVFSGNAATLGNEDQLQRIKDEILERQKMVDELERMQPKQKRTKL